MDKPTMPLDRTMSPSSTRMKTNLLRVAISLSIASSAVRTRAQTASNSRCPNSRDQLESNSLHCNSPSTSNNLIKSRLRMRPKRLLPMPPLLQTQVRNKQTLSMLLIKKPLMLLPPKKSPKLRKKPSSFPVPPPSLMSLSH